MDRPKALIEREEQSWQALSSEREAAQTFYRALLTEGAVMLFPGGLRVEGKEKILASIGAQPWASFEIKEPRVIPLSKEAGAVVYKVTAQREGRAPYEALVSSTYVRREGAWRLALHQQTPV